MNISVGSVICASAITAVTTAVVAVIVYERHAKEPDPVAIPCPVDTTLRTEVTPAPSVALTKPPPVTVPGCDDDEVACVLKNYAGACCEQVKAAGKARRAKLFEKALDLERQAVMVLLRSDLEACNTRGFKGVVTTVITIARSGTVETVTFKDSNADADLTRCMTEVIKLADFGTSEHVVTFIAPLKLGS